MTVTQDKFEKAWKAKRASLALTDAQLPRRVFRAPVNYYIAWRVLIKCPLRSPAVWSVFYDNYVKAMDAHYNEECGGYWGLLNITGEDAIEAARALHHTNISRFIAAINISRIADVNLPECDFKDPSGRFDINTPENQQLLKERNEILERSKVVASKHKKDSNMVSYETHRKVLAENKALRVQVAKLQADLAALGGVEEEFTSEEEEEEEDAEDNPDVNSDDDDEELNSDDDDVIVATQRYPGKGAYYLAQQKAEADAAQEKIAAEKKAAEIVIVDDVINPEQPATIEIAEDPTPSLTQPAADAAMENLGFPPNLDDIAGFELPNVAAQQPSDSAVEPTA